MHKQAIPPTLFALIFVLTLPLAAQTRPWQPDEAVKKKLSEWVHGKAAQLTSTDLAKGVSVRELSSFILNGASVGYDPVALDRSVDLMARCQILDPGHKFYGNMYWYWGDAAVNDANSIQFNTRVLIFVWTHYRQNLLPATQVKLEKILRLAVEGVKRQGVRVSYSNIYLMKIFNLIALGEALGLPEVAAEGYAHLDRFTAFTWENGIAEYLSPTYTAVDLENLALVKNYAAKESGRKTAETLLVYMYVDVAANWFLPAARLGGTHSRDYDRLTGHGALDRMVAQAGLALSPVVKPPTENPADFFGFWALDPEVVKKWVGPKPRRITQRWNRRDDTPAEYAEHLLGDAVSIASASANYWDMDKSPLVINLGPGSDVPQLQFLMDGRGDWYGKKKILERSGHMKNLHLTPLLTSVQKGDSVLGAATVASKKAELTDGAEAIFLLPADAQYYLGGKPLNVPTARSKWIETPGSDGSETILELLPENKKSTLHLVDRAANKGNGISQKIPVTPGHFYRQTVLLSGGTLNLYMTFFDESGARLGDERITPIQGEGAMKWFEQTHQAPSGAAICQVWFYSKSADQTDVKIADTVFEDRGPSPTGKAGANLTPFDFVTTPVVKVGVASGATLTARRGDVAASIRPILARGADGKDVPWVLMNDGLNYGTLRLTALLDPKITGERVACAFWARAAEGLADEGRFQKFIKECEAVKTSAQFASNLSASATSPGGGEMSLTLDPSQNKVVERKGGDGGPETALLMINGRDVGREILRPLPAVEAFLAGHKSGRVVLPPTAILTETNFVPNPGNSLPRHWTAQFEANGSTTQMATAAQDGLVAVNVVDRDGAKGVGFRRQVPVTPGKTYVFKARLKGSGINMYVNFLDDKGAALGPENKDFFPGAAVFKAAEYKIKAPAGAASAWLWFYSSTKGLADVWVAAPEFVRLEDF